MTAARIYVRFQSPTPNARGVRPGIFALVNGLAADGLLTADEERLRLEGNAWFHANFTDPTTVDPTVYDRGLHPGAVAWFKVSATHLIDRAAQYLAVLERHGVACEKAVTDAPGVLIYEDADQVVVVPAAGHGKRAATLR